MTSLQTIEQTAARLRAGAVTAAELAAASLEQIEREQTTINAFITVTPELALRQAERVDRELAAGQDHGPLMGIPIGIKDLFDTKDIRTTCASRLLADWMPDEDAAVVRKLRDAGRPVRGSRKPRRDERESADPAGGLPDSVHGYCLLR